MPFTNILTSANRLIYSFFPAIEPNELDFGSERLPGRHGLFRIGLIMVMMAALTYLMSVIGFTLAVFLFVTAVLFGLEGVRFLKSLYYGVMFSGSIFFIFRYLMEVDLPRGWLGL